MKEPRTIPIPNPKRVYDGGSDRVCAICGRDITGVAHMVHLVDGGASIAHPADAILYRDESSDLGLLPVGSECARRIPSEYKRLEGARPDAYEHTISDVDDLISRMALKQFVVVSITGANRRAFGQDLGLRRDGVTFTANVLIPQDVTDAAIADGLLYVDAEPALGGKVATLTPRGEARAKAGAK